VPLTGKQRHHLRALAHHLDPVVQIGHEGLTDAVVAQIDEALAAHELIKVRLGKECPIDRDTAGAEISARTRSEVAQAIGHVLVVFRRRPKKPKVDLPSKSGEKRKAKPKGSKGRRVVRRKKKPRLRRPR